MRVLIADDDRVLTTLLTAAMIRRRWIVQTAHDAMQAFMYANRNPTPDAILLDINMPAGTGIHTLQRLRTSTRTAAIPVIVVTASVDPGVEQQARALGVVAFLRKPIEPAVVCDLVSDAVLLAGVE